MTRFAGKLAISAIFGGKLAIFDGFVACLAAPLVLWVPESLPACAALWQPAETDSGLRKGIRTDWMLL